MSNHFNSIQKKRMRTQYLVELAAFVALTLVLSLTPLGYVPISALKLSLLMVPVTIGGAILGPLGGLILGLVFGVTSFLTGVFGTDPLSVILIGVNPFYFFLLCIPTRVLAGWGGAMLYRVIAKNTKLRGTAAGISCFVGSYLNTALFCGLLWLLFRTVDISSLGIAAVAVLSASGLLQGLAEAGIAAVIGGAVIGALNQRTKHARHN